MRFQYEYRTSDNARHAGVIDAPTREAAFQSLREKGIRPALLTEAPGFFNHLFGKGKRWLAIGVLGALLIAVFVAWVRTGQRADRETYFLTDTTRRQVIGDAAVIEKGILDGWSDVFASEGDRFLASFAIPGVKARVRNTSAEALEACLKEARIDARGASLEALQIMAMVEGMKEELRAFLADGGTIAEYGNLLVRRQEEEIAHYNRAKTEIDTIAQSIRHDAQGMELLRSRWDMANDRLRKMGIKLVPWPEK